MLSFVDPEQTGRDVVVTGVGMVTPLGGSARQSWAALVRGDRAGRFLTESDIDHCGPLSRFLGRPAMGAPVAASCGSVMDSWIRPDATLPDDIFAAWSQEPFVTYLLTALADAANSAKLALPLTDPLRSACVIGASKGGLRTLEQQSRLLRSHVPDDPRSAYPPAPAWQWAAHPDAALRAAAWVTNAQAYLNCPVAACASGTLAVLTAARAIQADRCDVCIAGSSDAGLRASVASAFHRLQVTSRHPDPATACRPFDPSRDGFLIGEGAGVLILESRQHADARGARILARITAGGFLSDPAGMTRIDAGGTVVAELIRRTLEVTSEQRPVGWVSVHGTGTDSNDLAESVGIHAAFGGMPPACTGWKGSLGHLLGAAGSVECGLAVISLERGIIPGTVNHMQTDRRCPIPVAQTTQPAQETERILKLSLGFGGHVICLVIDREGPTSQVGETGE